MSTNKGAVKTLFALFFVFSAVFAFAGKDSCVGKIEIEYHADGECGTTSRLCCSDGYYSDWGKPCQAKKAGDCSAEECWNGNICEVKPTDKCTCSNGTCNRSYICIRGDGWKYNDDKCVCSGVYKWNKKTKSCEFPYEVQKSEYEDHLVVYATGVFGGKYTGKKLKRKEDEVLKRCNDATQSAKKDLIAAGNYGVLSIYDCPRSNSFFLSECRITESTPETKGSMAVVIASYTKAEYKCIKAFYWE